VKRGIDLYYVPQGLKAEKTLEFHGEEPATKVLKGTSETSCGLMIQRVYSVTLGDGYSHDMQELQRKGWFYERGGRGGLPDVQSEGTYSCSSLIQATCMPSVVMWVMPSNIKRYLGGGMWEL
jgi:hypothetical protein